MMTGMRDGEKEGKKVGGEPVEERKLQRSKKEILGATAKSTRLPGGHRCPGPRRTRAVKKAFLEKAGFDLQGKQTFQVDRSSSINKCISAEKREVREVVL